MWMLNSDHVPINVGIEKVFWSTREEAGPANQNSTAQSTRIRWKTSKLRGPPEQTGEFDDDGRPIMITQKQKWAEFLNDYMGKLQSEGTLDYNQWELLNTFFFDITFKAE